jgi:hypothetical protein
MLFNSGIIFLNAEGKIEMNLNAKTFDALKSIYLENYDKLIDAYINKEDATIFLERYLTNEDGCFVPKDEKIKKFVQHYYDLFEKIGNVIVE